MSGQASGVPVGLEGVHGGSSPGVRHATELIAFTEAVMASDDSALDSARRRLRGVLDDAAFVDTCAVIGAFNVVDRIADATGIRLDDGLRAVSADVRKELDLAAFASSANTPGD